MTKRNKNEAKFKAWFNATSIKELSILKRAAIEIVCFVLASVAAYIIVVYSKAILIIFFELTSLLSYNGASNDAPALASSKPFEGARNIAFALTALVGGPFLVWRTILADRQTKTAQEQTTIAQEKVSIDEQTHYTTLYIKSIELLGATHVVKTADGKERTERAMELRLGAIYALERIARDSVKDHWPIMEVLSAYIRENSPNALKYLDDISEAQNNKKITHDIQAAVTVIGMLNKKWIEEENNESRFINLSEVNFSGTNFTNLYFANTIFNGSYFQGLLTQNTNFDGAEFYRCDFLYTRFEFTSLNCSKFSDTKFVDVTFSRCSLVNVSFSLRFKNSITFHKCDLKHSLFASFETPYIILGMCNLYMSTIEVENFKKIDFRGSILCSTKLHATFFETPVLKEALLVDRENKFHGVTLSAEITLKYALDTALADKIFKTLKTTGYLSDAKLSEIQAIIDKHTP